MTYQTTIDCIGANFIPSLLERELLDEIIVITDDEAMKTACRLSQEAGLPVGISSGAAYSAAEQIAARDPGKTVVALLPDTGIRFLSTGIYG